MTTLEMIVNHNIRERHVLVCGKHVARESIRTLRMVRNTPKMLAALAEAKRIGNSK